MVQTRICSYFKFHCEHASSTPITFERLPQDVRDRIYLEADLGAESVLRVKGHALPNDLEFRYNALMCVSRVQSESYFCIVEPDSLVEHEVL